MKNSIVVVSGLPRSGTSLMMQMLRSAGLTVLTDGVRTADKNNRHGYFEWEPIKQLARNPKCIEEAEGKAVKVISFHLVSLPASFNYKIIFMERHLSEVAASQGKMIAQLGAQKPVPEEQIVQALTMHRNQVNAWITSHAELQVLRVEHMVLMSDALGEAARVTEFLELGSIDPELMASQVDPSQWRNRSSCDTMCP